MKDNNDQKKGFNYMKAAMVGTAAIVGTVAAVKLSKKENREKIKNLINKYTKDGAEFGKKAVIFADKVMNAPELTEPAKKMTTGVKKVFKKI